MKKLSGVGLFTGLIPCKLNGVDLLGKLFFFDADVADDANNTDFLTPFLRADYDSEIEIPRNSG